MGLLVEKNKKFQGGVSEHIYKRAFERCPSPLAGLDRDGYIYDVNPAFERIFKCSRDTAIGSAILDFLSGEDHERFMHFRNQKALSSLENFRVGEQTFLGIRGDGTKFSLALSLTFFQSDDDDLQFLAARQILTSEKVEECLWAENAILTKKVAALEVLNKRLRTVLHSTFHDLRTPLMSISGFASILIRDHLSVVNENGERFCNKIINSSKKTQDLISGLLGLIQTDGYQIKKEKILINDLAKEVMAELNGINEKHRPEIRMDPEITCYGDAIIVNLVLRNLLANAFKFTSKTEAPRIEIGIQRGQSGNVFYVKDNGAGFDSRKCNGMFSEFQRLHSKEDFSGMGLGLSVCQQMMALCGGRLWATGEVGRGACFYFSFPD